MPPQFQSWRTINAQALVTGRVTRQQDGRLKAEFRLWDVNQQQQLTGIELAAVPVGIPDRQHGDDRRPDPIDRSAQALGWVDHVEQPRGADFQNRN